MKVIKQIIELFLFFKNTFNTRKYFLNDMINQTRHEKVTCASSVGNELCNWFDRCT